MGTHNIVMLHADSLLVELQLVQLQLLSCAHSGNTPFQIKSDQQHDSNSRPHY